MSLSPVKALALLAGALLLLACSNPRRTAIPAAATVSSGGDAAAPVAAHAQVGAQATPSSGGYVIADPTFQPMRGARAMYGTLGGAAYEIEIPNNWNGDLVLYEHGFTGNDPVLFVQTPPIRSHLIDRGFAWAASSFSASGYVPDVGLRDSLALLDYFKQNVGAPGHTYIYGTSMGGHVVVSAMEQDPQLFSGALSECGVVMGEEELNYVLSWVLLSEYFSGVPLYPIGEVSAYQNLVRSQVLPALGPVDRPSQAGAAFEDAIENLTGGPRPWRHLGFADRRSGNFELPATENPESPSIAYLAASNAGAVYHVDPGFGVDDATLNAAIRRVNGFAPARDPNAHPDFAPRTGMLQAPLLTLHTTGDHFVPISQEQQYRWLVDAAGAWPFLVQRAIRRPDHCQFSNQERVRAFDDLVAWVQTGVQPAGDDLSNPDLSNVGLAFTDPLLKGDPGAE